MICTLCSNFVVSRMAFTDSLRVSVRAGPLSSESLRFGMVVVDECGFGCWNFASVVDFLEGFSRRQ